MDDSEVFNRTMGRKGRPEEIAYGMVFPTSEELSFLIQIESRSNAASSPASGGWWTALMVCEVVGRSRLCGVRKSTAGPPPIFISPINLPHNHPIDPSRRAYTDVRPRFGIASRQLAS